MYRSGLIIGKFMPLHKGHEYLINTALEQCVRLTILVVDNPDYPIPAATRVDWILDTFPQVECWFIPDIYDDDNSDAWADHARATLAPGYDDLDVVFTSEEYGEPWARALGVAHVCVDLPRRLFPISGTELRKNFWDHAEMVGPRVRRSFVKKIVIAGGESTGKSTLARALAERLRTAHVIEYGRPYWEGRQHTPLPWRPDELDHIFDMQMLMEDKLATVANRFLICDTDWLATYVWQRDHLGITEYMYPSIGNAHWRANLYLVCQTDIPFEDDGTRDGDEQTRERQQADTLALLRRHELPYIMVQGSLDERLDFCERVLGWM